MSQRIDYRIPVVLIGILASGCATTEYGCKGMPEDPDLKPLGGDLRFTALLAYANSRTTSSPAK